MSETLTQSDESPKVYEEGYGYSAIESDDGLAEAFKGNRNAVCMLAESTEIGRAQADALREWLIDDVKAESKALEDALTAIRPLLTAKYEGIVQTPEERQSGGANLMLDVLLQCRLPETREHMWTFEEAMEALQLEFGGSDSRNCVTKEEVAWLQCDGLLTLAKSAEAARREHDSHCPDNNDSPAHNAYNPYVSARTSRYQTPNRKDTR